MSEEEHTPRASEAETATDEAAARESDTLEALAALADDDGAREVDDPDPATLSGHIPALEDIPDATPRGAAGDAQESASDPEATDAIDRIELAALMAENDSPSQTLPFAPVKPTAPTSSIAVERISGAAKGTGSLAWGSRTDVGRVRSHNEDSFVIRFPLFAVADGMGGHAAGEVASTIAVSTIASSAPNVPDPDALAASIEEANRAVIEGALSGLGRPGMGTTCTSVVIDGQTMAVGHVGDSRCYLLHAGQLVRVTHDHSYVEELVAAGEITPEEARIHPNRSIITRALGSDPNMKADSFTVAVARHDRVMLCSDGLSSMISDDVIEEAMVSSPAPQACADALVDLALAAGGHDNVTCIVIDVKDDGVASRALKMRLRNIGIACAAALVVLLVAWIGLLGISSRYWYLADLDGYVALYRGFPGTPSFLGTSDLQEVTSIPTESLSDAIEQRLMQGISFESEDEARAVLDEYRSKAGGAQPASGQGTPASDGAGETAATDGASGLADGAGAATVPSDGAVPSGEGA